MFTLIEYLSDNVRPAQLALAAIADLIFFGSLWFGYWRARVKARNNTD